MRSMLPRRVVDVWWTAIDAIQADTRVLSHSERERGARFSREADRHRYQASRIWLRKTLAGYIDAAPQNLVFTYGPHGKPSLASPDPSWEFSLAHSGPFAALAVNQHQPIGIDVEVIRPGAYDPPSASLVLSPIEREFIDGSPDPDIAFLRCWTRKEAYAKVDGRGLERALAEVTLTGLEGQPLRVDGYKVVDFPVQGAMGAAAIPLDHGLRTE